MNRVQTEDAIKVMQAWVDGKDIEYFNPLYDQWADINFAEDPVWNWNDFSYRVKQEPRVVYIRETSSGDGLIPGWFTSLEQNEKNGNGKYRKFVEVIE